MGRKPKFDKKRNCLKCGSNRLVKNGYDSKGTQKYLCQNCKTAAPFSKKLISKPRKYIFIGANGTEYTVSGIVEKMAAQGSYISHDTALRRLKIAIDDPSREDELLAVRVNCGRKNNSGIPGERLTREQREAMSQLKAVADGKISLNEFLRS